MLASRAEEHLIRLQEALLREKQKNVRLENKLQQITGMVHDFSQRLHRMEFGITQDGIGELNAYGVHNGRE